MGPCRTADEDFGMLLEAALMYDRRVAALLGESDSTSDTPLDTYPHSWTASPFPNLLIVVTGMLQCHWFVGQRWIKLYYHLLV